MKRGTLAPAAFPVMIAIALLALGAGPLNAGFAATESYLPSVGVGKGSGTSYWYTVVWVHNPNNAPVNVQLFFLERDRANSNPLSYSETIPAGDTRRYADAMTTLFGVTGRKFGAIRVVANDRVVVNGRIYSKLQGGPEEDSVGQFFGAVPASFAIAAGQSTRLLGVYQTSPQDDSDYRYNFGFVETSGSSASVEVTAIDETGQVLGSKTYSVQAYEPRQFNVTDLLPGIDATNLTLEVEVVSGSGRVAAFGAVAANGTNDPSTFEMQYRDELLAENASTGGIAGVTAGAGLTGGGSTGTVTLNVGGGDGIQVGSDAISLSELGVTTGKLAASAVTTAKLANAAVTPAKVSTSGGNDGQVLTVTGSGAAWQDAGLGFTLPYSSEASNASTLFSISNTGAGIGVRGSSNSSQGVFGQSGTGSGLAGMSMTGTGVQGVSTSGPGVTGKSGSGSGLAALGSPGVYGDAASSAGVYGTSSSAAGVLGQSTSNSGVGGVSTSGNGVTGVSTSGFGVSGESGGAYGVYGKGNAASTKAVFGVNTANGNYGELGGAYGAYGRHEVAGTSGYLGTTAAGVEGYSGSGFGVSGETATSYGVYGKGTGASAKGVFGVNTATGNYGELGSSYGAYGRHENSGNAGYLGTSSAGVLGTSSSGEAGHFEGKVNATASTSDYALRSENTGSGDGVRAYANTSSLYYAAIYGVNSGSGPGIYGKSTSGPAAFLDGNVTVVGTLSKGGGSFKIDHPLDPENRYLYHSFVESPDMMNVYNGNVILDGDGAAWIELPEWFEALNREFRYQLTCIGAFAPVFVAETISGNRFRIAGGRVGLEVSWQVTGIRHDPFAERHRIPVEEVKPPEELGTYLHPGAWGVPPDRGLYGAKNDTP